MMTLMMMHHRLHILYSLCKMNLCKSFLLPTCKNKEKKLIYKSKKQFLFFFAKKLLQNNKKN